MLGTGVFHGVARVAHIFIAQPPGEHHHHVGGAVCALRGGLLQKFGCLQLPQQLPQSLFFQRQDVFHLAFHMPVLAEQIVQITVNKAVAPHQLEQAVHKKPTVLEVAHVSRSGQEVAHLGLVAVKQAVHQQLFAGVVVEQIAGADAHV